MLNEELEKKLIEDLNKTGFGSEMKAIKTFLERDWNCSGGYGYLDDNKTREIDLQAQRHLQQSISPSGFLRVSFCIIAEVKKSDKPWIAFRTDFKNKDYEAIDPLNNLISLSNISFKRLYNNEKHRILYSTSINTIPMRLGWAAYGLHESFKSPDAPSKWYSAFVSVCKAANFWLSENKARDLGKDFFDFVIVKPIVILDGILTSASLDIKGDLVLREEEFAPFNFPFVLPNHSSNENYHIDVVTLRNLEKYLEICEFRIDDIFTQISTLINDKFSK